MPLAPSLPALRRDIQEILVEDLAAALNALKELLPEGSEKRRTVEELRARFNDANKQSFRGVITNEQLQLVYNQIRSAVFDLLEGLEEEDFEVKEKAASAKAMAAKQGSVLYRVPHRMPLRKPTICTVRVAIDEEAILEDIVLDDEVRLRSRVEVSDMMKAELLDPEGDVFTIRPLSEPEQLVRDTGYTQWLFSVTPRVEGEHQLLVKVSMMEFNANLGKYIPREVSILETITIVTETAVSDLDDAPMKATGEQFTLGPEVPGEVIAPPPAVVPAAPATSIPRPSTIYTPQREIPSSPTPKSAIPNSGLRTVAFFLIFLVTGTTATWAFTPPPTRDWWVASLKDSPEAYSEYIEKYKDTDANQHLEKAYFRKADKTEALRDLREYQRAYPQGQYREQVSEKVEMLEIKTLESIRQQPAAEKIQQFVRDFPESERLPVLREAVAARTELLPVVENAYIQSIQVQPSPRKVEAFLRDFPQSEYLPEVAKAAAARPEVLRAVQPVLENAFLKKMEQNPDAPQAEQFLETFPVPTQREKFEQILEKKPALKNRFLQKMEKAAEEQKVREEEGRPEQQLSESFKLSESSQVDKTAEQPENQQSTNEQPTTDSPQRNRKSGLEMVRVTGGTFTMGDDKDADKDNCEFRVRVKTFKIGKYEVTQADWREVMGDDPSYNKGCDDCPVEDVSWDDVQAFIKKLNAKTRKKYRLPSEAEWEYAARGGNQSKGYIYSGSNDVDKVAWYSSNSEVGNTFGSQKSTRPVGTKAPNELGIYDMSGNVWEWCQDKYGSYPGCSELKGASYDRVFRGGAWYLDYFSCTVRRRDSDYPRLKSDGLGFRLAQDK